MIIEMYGPPGAGKTTLTRALSERLRARNINVEVFSSARPNEIMFDYSTHQHPAGFRRGIVGRFGRPLGEIATVVRHPITNYPQFITALRAMRIFYGMKATAHLRQAQYLVRLAQSWKAADKLNGVAIFDQGFLQAICSLAHNTGEARMSVIKRAIRTAPPAQIAVRVMAPVDKVESRLSERRYRQGFLERYLENDVGPILRDLEIYDLISRALAACGRTVISVASTDEASLEAAVRDITDKVDALLPGAWKGAA